MLMKIIPAFLIAATMAIGCREVPAQTTATTTAVGFLNIQGVLHENGGPVNGFMWFCWDIYDVPTGGKAVWHFPSGDFAYADFRETLYGPPLPY